ncbi:MAG: 7TM diverse intracellular signaling domain-containing protein [Cytophagaceae bacterium]
MRRYWIALVLYALVLSCYGMDTLSVYRAREMEIFAPFLKYRITRAKDAVWEKISRDKVMVNPGDIFHAEALFRPETDAALVFEWADNKIEFLKAGIVNTKGDTCAHLFFDDTEGYNNQLFVKNHVMVFQRPVAGETYRLLYKLKAHNPVYAMCWISDMDIFIKRFIREYTWYGIFSGMIMIIFSLNALFYIILRDKTFLWYALYTIALGIFHWSYTGVGFQWLWPDLPIWNRYAYMYASFFMLSMQFIYFRYYIKNLNFLNEWYIISIIVARLAILMISIFSPDFREWFFLSDFFTFSYLLFLQIKIKLYETLHGKMFITSVSLLLSSYLIFILAFYHIIPNSVWAYNSLAVGGSLELLVGLLALALRYKYLGDEKDKLKQSEISSLTKISSLKDQLIYETKEKARIQKEINKELEIKIAERTIELAKKNEDLEALNKKLNEISKTLDKQNWSLNKELRSDRITLMWGKNISFSEFTRSFPAEDHVLRFIADLKWEDGYSCKKCGSSDWTAGIQFQARKCNSCKYEESVTANTLFHGVKFPLIKALYISLATVINRENISVRQIASEIELREATVWTFRKKTLDKIASATNNQGEILKCFVRMEI